MPKHCPGSVQASFAGVVAGAVMGVLDPGSFARHAGWAFALIALAALLIGLSRWIVAEVASARMQFLGQIAEMRIGHSASVRVPDIDAEWRSLQQEE